MSARFPKWAQKPGSVSRLQQRLADQYYRLFRYYLTLEQRDELKAIAQGEWTYQDAFAVIGSLIQLERRMMELNVIPSKKRFQMRLIEILLERA